ncbi:hypothetical protein ACHQM5_003921 [Ranunculus cassubicifolius]
MQTTTFSFLISFFLFYLTLVIIVAEATVPSSKTFTFVNQGEFGEYSVEYQADYRLVTGLFTDPFAICESTMKWVWDANRGNLVKEGAKLSFGVDGNLVLADVDGRIAWQTGTVNKGVVGISLLSSGNLVLYDNSNKFIWQSFDYPSDTLLPEQSLRRGGPTALVSRVSYMDGSKGPYSFFMGTKTLAMSLKSKNSPKPIVYHQYKSLERQDGTLSSVTFESTPENGEPYAYRLQFRMLIGNETFGLTGIVGRPKYNSTFSMLRVESDGSLKAYTYYDKVDEGRWDITYSLFDKNGDAHSTSECQLPTRCGSLGVCEDSQCVACPRPQGLLGWSKACAPPSLPACKSGGSLNARYYKVVGVDHFMDAYNQGEGPMKVSQCRDKCDKDCGCLAFFYKEKSSMCLLAPVLGTLTQVTNSSHVGVYQNEIR